MTIPAALMIPLAACIAASLVRSLRRHASLTTPSSIVSVTVLDDSTVVVDRRRGAARTAEVLGTSYVSSTLTVLNLKIVGRRLVEHVLVVPDNVDPEAFRQLRVVLRWRHRARH
jgi:hypothetical protein